MGTPSDSPTSHVLSVDGRRLHCLLRTGQGGGAPVLLVHGGGAHAHWWDALVPALDGHMSIAPDLRGHGQSDWAERYLIEDFGADLLAVLDALAPPVPVALIGHSMGGRITTWLAAHHPQRVRAMALLDARLGQIKAERADQWRARRAAGTPRPGHATRAVAQAAFRLTPAEPGIAAEVLANLAAHAVHQRDDGLWDLCFDRAVLDLDGSRVGDLLPLLARVQCPTLIAYGAESTVIGPAQAAACAAALPAARCEMLLGGHHFLLADPAGVGRLLREFLAEHAGPP